MILETNLRILVCDPTFSAANDASDSRMPWNELGFANVTTLNDLRQLWFSNVFHSAEKLFEYLYAANPGIIQKYLTYDLSDEITYSESKWKFRQLPDRKNVDFKRKYVRSTRSTKK